MAWPRVPALCKMVFAMMVDFSTGRWLNPSISSSLRRKLSRRGLVKTERFFCYTGITTKEYIEHFEVDPLWDRYCGGEILHIDHIIPASAYDLNDMDELRRCWNCRNLRFLTREENMAKFNRLDMELVEKYAIHDLLPKSISVGGVCLDSRIKWKGSKVNE